MVICHLRRHLDIIFPVTIGPLGAGSGVLISSFGAHNSATIVAALGSHLLSAILRIHTTGNQASHFH